MKQRVLATGTAILIALVGAAGAVPAGADTSSPSNVPYTCTTNGFGNQPASYSATITDSADPATVGATVTYRFVVPFDQDPPPVTATYQGGTVRYPIPAGLSVTSVSTPPKAGSALSSSAAVQGGDVVVTTTGNQPIDGNSHPAPDLLVTGTVTSAAAGVGVRWKTPSLLTANVHTDIVGDVVATCTPDDPSVVIATTTVPAAPTGPVAKSQSVAVQQGATKAITLSATDPDTPQSQLVYAIATPPAHGTVTGTAPNVAYTSAATFSGADSFTFTVRDPGGLTSTGTVTINVFPSNVIDNAPPLVTITAPTNGAVYTPSQVVNAAFTCSDATTAVNACTGTNAVGTRVASTVGQHTFVVTAQDSAKNTTTKTVSYRVIDPALVQQSYNATGKIPMTCDDPGGLQPTDLPAVVSAPTQVGASRTMTFRLAVGAGSVPALTSATNLVYTLGTPINGTAQSATLVAGTGTANARASAAVTVTGGKAVLTIAGPIAGGTTAATPYTPPAIDVTIVAGGTPGTAVRTELAGTRVTQAPTGLPQLAVTRTCTAGDAAGGRPNPLLTSTAILDTTPPAVTLDQPLHGAVFAVGAAVPASFGCSDAVLVASCTGTVASGAAIDTATPGVKSMVVTARDSSGNVAQTVASYTVVQVTFTARFAAGEVAGLDATAAYFGTDRPGLVRLGVAVIGYVVSVAGPPAAPVSPAPANTGTVAVSTTYSVTQAQQVSLVAAMYGLTGDQLHRYGANIAMYVYAVQHG
jgi:hypothetical protein